MPQNPAAEASEPAKEPAKKSSNGWNQRKEYQQRLAPSLKLTAMVQELVYDEMVKFDDRRFKDRRVQARAETVRSAHRLLPKRGLQKVQDKAEPEAVGGYVDLIRKGDFVGGCSSCPAHFYALAGSLFGSRDKKRNSLVDKYGKDILYFNPTTLTRFERDLIVPRFVKTVKTRFRIDKSAYNSIENIPARVFFEIRDTGNYHLRAKNG